MNEQNSNKTNPRPAPRSHLLILEDRLPASVIVYFYLIRVGQASLFLERPYDFVQVRVHHDIRCGYKRIKCSKPRTNEKKTKIVKKKNEPKEWRKTQKKKMNHVGFGRRGQQQRKKRKKKTQ